MIEKIAPDVTLDIDGLPTTIVDSSKLMQKINEIINVLNAIVVETKDDTFIGGSKKAEPVDKFAEQRKWIGKLCRFRDEDYKDDQWDYGLLQAVAIAETVHIWKTGSFKHNLGHWYDYCELVKPDDDIIYKGE